MAILKKICKLCLDLKWWEMLPKMNFGHPKWPLAAILKKRKLYFDLKWRDMQTEINFGRHKWPMVTILKKVESCVAGCILGLSFGSYIVDVVFCWCCCGVLYCCCCDWLKSNWCYVCCCWWCLGTNCCLVSWLCVAFTLAVCCSAMNSCIVLNKS